MAATGAEGDAGLEETWESLADACHELSSHGMGPAHRVPGLGRQGPALPSDRGRARHHGRGRAGLGREPGRPREERLRGEQRALDRRAPCPARTRGLRGVRRRDEDPAGPGGRAVRGGMGGRRLEPGRAAPPRRLHGGARLRQLGARAGRTACAGPPRWQREPRVGDGARRGCRTPCPSSWGRRPRAPTAPPSGSRWQVRETTHAPSRSPSRKAGPSRSTSRSVPTVVLSLSSLDFMRLGCGRTTAAQLAEQGTGVLRRG